jgi:phage-related protein
LLGDQPKIGCVFFRTSTGHEPVREWLRGLDAPTRKTIGRDVLDVQYRWPVSRPLVGSLGDGLFEVRTSCAAGEFRVLFYICASDMVVLHGFCKKTNKVPKSELSVASERKRLHERNGR